MKKIYLLFLALMLSYGQVFAQLKIQNVRVEYSVPKDGITINTPNPRFSWQLLAGEERNGVVQEAYSIQVNDKKGFEVWNSGKIASSSAIGINLNGSNLLKPNSNYTYRLRVWDNEGYEAVHEGDFFTGLFDDSYDAWSGAKWIGGGDNDLVFYSHYFSVYKFHYGIQIVENSDQAAFVFGANDARLMDSNLNIQGVESGKNDSFIAFELDISGLKEAGGLAKLHVYRVGYDLSDKRDEIFKSLEIPKSIINLGNMHERHDIFAESNFGVFTIYINGENPENRISPFDPNAPRFQQQGLNLNPIGAGNNFISFPMLGDIGFWLKAGQNANFFGVQIRNFRQPSNLLFFEKLNDSKSIFYGPGLSISGNKYQLSGGQNGTLILADPSRNASPMLRTVFRTENKKIENARLYITARGIYEVYANGYRVGNDYFNPGLTQYDKHHPYQVYSIDLEQDSENVIAAWLSEGWWSGNITYSGENWNYFGDRQSLLAKLVISYEDGSEQIVVSDPETWKIYHDGPIRYGSFFQGEVYDGGKELNGWTEKGFDDGDWKFSQEVPLEGTAFMDPNGNPQSAELIRGYDQMKFIYHQDPSPKIVKTLHAKSVEEVRPGVFVYDMGQNLVGFPKIQLKDARPGQKVTMRFAEVKYPNLPEHEGLEGMIMLENIRAALAQDIFIAKGGNEVIQPRFTFHGYRFLEITGIDNAIPIEDVQGLVVSSIDELTAHYETSNPLVNKLWENITWSMRGNFLSIPTDTPARNERMGWSGDINVFARTATYMADVNLFLKRHLLAMRDIQKPDGRFPDVAPVGGGFGGTLWGAAGIIVPWETYLQYGDEKVLSDHYSAMQRYVDFLEDKTSGEGILNEGPLGDWLSPENNKNDNTLLWTAYQIYCLEILEKVSEILGSESERGKYHSKWAERRAFFNKTYLNSDGKTIKSGMQTGVMLPLGESAAVHQSAKGQLVDTQGSYAIALDMGAVEEKYKERTLSNFLETIQRKNVDDLDQNRPEYSLMTGFIGTASIATALSEAGKHETVYRLLQQTSYPSWLYSVVNGATTIWERLNSFTIEDGFGGNNSMNSFNHYSFGAIGAWMINYSLGIQRDLSSPGFQKFVLQPKPDPDEVMTWAKGHYDSMYGRIESSWKIEEDSIIYEFSVPTNTEAILKLQASDITQVILSGKLLKEALGIKVLDQEEGIVKILLGSGRYQFKVEKGNRPVRVQKPDRSIF
ncbi:Alfa-L-rhamnosidase [Indibacter alkaliphilus LW1]|uniref:alpha-L-rhamnosidase n=1 Tax=Indibacter alkaliphilus (strain CCUG 57479 / KCTC 22604 / LW1) TaxID=1189612 RepID=S2E4Y5_INDAL|nr:alpha-L-rhamnosidase [Indibacter alkaliphilus]EOZ99636.1 Alfa-L-rhamnosidase [Indibacter alkaliphilus LW1]